MARVDMH